MKRYSLPLLALALALAITQTVAAMADTFAYVDWTSTSGNQVFGTLRTLTGSVNVTFTGDFTFAQLNNTGSNFYLPSSSYTNATVSNPPTNVDIVALDERGSTHNSISFSKPVHNPIIDIVSLGWYPVSDIWYTFDQVPTLLSQGPDIWNGAAPNCSDPLAPCLSLSGNVLYGREGSGVLQFQGDISEISWDTQGAEFWNGFTVGDPVPEPGSLLLLGTGLLGLALIVFRKFKADRPLMLNM